MRGPTRRNVNGSLVMSAGAFRIMLHTPEEGGVSMMHLGGHQRLYVLVVASVVVYSLTGCHSGGAPDVASPATVGGHPELAQAGLRGDLNGNGNPDITDAVGILRIIVALDPANALADCNCDEQTTITDAIALLRCLVGFDPWPITCVVIPNVYQGTWMVAVLNPDEALRGVAMFTVAANGAISLGSSEVAASGNVSATGELTAEGSISGTTFDAAGTLLDDDTGTGTWTQYQGATQVGNGTLLFWRANGGQFAGTWDVVVSGAQNGAGVVVVDANGLISGTVTTGIFQSAVSGVVTGSGTVVVAWTVANIPILADGPADGYASGSQATGSWRSGGIGSGTWTATKR